MTTPTLFTEALAGRGLWIGLFPPADCSPAGLSPELPSAPGDLHCTLVHLGKRAPDATVEQAIRAASVASVERVEIDAHTGGVARFRGSDAEGDPVVALLQHTGIRALRARLIELLDDALVPQTFDYTPHVTLSRCSRAEPLVVEAPRRVMIRFSRVGVVCGDARLYLAMRPA